MQRLYCQSKVYDLDILFKQREGAIKYVRKHDKPWRVSLSADMEYGKTIARKSGFKNIMEEIRENCWKSRKDLFASAHIIMNVKSPNIAIVRDYLVDEALDWGKEFFSIEALVRKPDGVNHGQDKNSTIAA
jgi:hypothetical protein